MGGDTVILAGLIFATAYVLSGVAGYLARRYYR